MIANKIHDVPDRLCSRCSQLWKGDCRANQEPESVEEGLNRRNSRPLCGPDGVDMEENKWFDEIDLSRKLIGRKIVALDYGPDADGDQQLYYIILESGTKIGIARVRSDGVICEEDRKKRYLDGTILRFQFLNWPIKKNRR